MEAVANITLFSTNVDGRQVVLDTLDRMSMTIE